MHKITKIFEAVRQVFKKPYYGFVRGHGYLDEKQLEHVRALVGKVDEEIVDAYERQYAALIGTGGCVSFAAARMAFFALLCEIRIGPGDEVILTGATCAVMANAVLRAGATPVYADFDLDTFGSSSVAIESVITPRSRVIVAQHSFGIPCDIEAIVKLAKQHSIYLLEDCALAVGSKVNGISVGNFGDAAIFSTDHSKPINTITGGLIYSKNKALVEKIRQLQKSSGQLGSDKQYYLWRRLLIEKKFCRPDRYGPLQIFDYVLTFAQKLTLWQNPFLSEDFSSKISETSYPYPAKLPSFLAQVGLFELQRWPEYQAARKQLFERLLGAVKQSMFSPYLPAAYFNKDLDIVPLRFAWAQPDGFDLRRSINDFVHVSWTWFMQPIIATPEPLENFGYQAGCCPDSEFAGENMINIPCNVASEYADQLVRLLELSFAQHSKTQKICR